MLPCLPSSAPSRLGATVLDKLKPRELLAVGGTFFLAVAILCAVGGAGPTIFTTAATQVSAPCSAAAPCVAPVSLALPSLSQWNQALGVVMRMRRPVSITGLPLGLGSPLSFTLVWTVAAATLNGAPIPGTINATHTSTLFWGPSDLDSSPAFVFGQVLLAPSDYALSLELSDPLAAFRGFPGLADGVTLLFTQNYVNTEYSKFEATNKVFFCVVSIILFAYYIFTLVRGRSPGTALTAEQLWVAFLGGFLFWYNDPLFITYLAAPTLATAAFSAFCTATFVAGLLMFFLCLADNSRLEGEGGRGQPLPQGALYWVPKVLLCAVTWALGLSLYVFQRLSALEDPTFTFSDKFGPAAVLWVGRFAAAIAALYLLYLAILLVLAFRKFRALSPSKKYLLTMSVAALILTMVGLFSQAFSGVRSPAILFLVSYGAPTMYIWNLMLVLRPGPAPEEWDTDTQGALGGSDHGRDVGLVVREAEEDAGEEALTEAVRGRNVACAHLSLLHPPIHSPTPTPTHTHTHTHITTQSKSTTAQEWNKRAPEEQWELVRQLQARLKQRGSRVLQHLGSGAPAAGAPPPPVQSRPPSSAPPPPHPQQREEEAEAEEH